MDTITLSAHDKDAIEKYVKVLDELDGLDTEGDHLEADTILIIALEALGLAELSSAWQRVELRSGGFWYA